jgi:hypothetical protein
MALDQDAIETAIEANVDQPRRVRYGSREVEQHSLKEQADLLDRVTPATDQPHFGLRFTKLVSPGCG